MHIREAYASAIAPRLASLVNQLGEDAKLVDLMAPFARHIVVGQEGGMPFRAHIAAHGPIDPTQLEYLAKLLSEVCDANDDEEARRRYAARLIFLFQSGIRERNELLSKVCSQH